MLTAAFSSFGNVQNVKLVRDKGGTANFRLANGARALRYRLVTEGPKLICLYTHSTS